MSEKLYKSHCRVPGHGTSCVVAKDIYPSKKQLSKIRRHADKKLILEITEQVLRDYSEAWEKLANA